MHTILIPIVFTVVFVGMMLRPYKSAGKIDLTPLLRIGWFAPIALTWIAYSLYVTFA